MTGDRWPVHFFGERRTGNGKRAFLLLNSWKVEELNRFGTGDRWPMTGAFIGKRRTGNGKRGFLLLNSWKVEELNRWDGWPMTDDRCIFRETWHGKRETWFLLLNSWKVEKLNRRGISVKSLNRAIVKSVWPMTDDRWRMNNEKNKNPNPKSQLLNPGRRKKDGWPMTDDRCIFRETGNGKRETCFFSVE